VRPHTGIKVYKLLIRHESDIYLKLILISDEDIVAPPPPKISESPPAAAKVSLNLKPGTPGLLKPAGFGKKIGIQMKLNQPAPKEPPKKITVAKAFNNDDSDDNDVEEVKI
jgi:hypothetical protein